MWTNARSIRAAFDSLLARGYSLAAESDAGIAGTIAYRSALLWLSFEWDRGEPWLTVTFTAVGPTPVMWTIVDRAVTGNEHPEYSPNTLPEAPVPTLQEFVKTVLPIVEARLESADSGFLETLRELEAGHRRELAAIRAARRFR